MKDRFTTIETTTMTTIIQLTTDMYMAIVKKKNMNLLISITKIGLPITINISVATEDWMIITGTNTKTFHRVGTQQCTLRTTDLVLSIVVEGTRGLFITKRSHSTMSTITCHRFTKIVTTMMNPQVMMHTIRMTLTKIIGQMNKLTPKLSKQST